MRETSAGGRLAEILHNGVKTLFYPAVAERASPGDAVEDGALNDEQRRQAARLMRVNHTGEVCAQALYQGQALFARDNDVAASLQEAADEEIDHLAWTSARVEELGGRTSALNPVFYGGAFALGALAALVSDKVSLGFVAETERQVSAHLQSHLDFLPEADAKSRAIVKQMDIDETRHATNAVEMGGVELPAPVKNAMRLMGKVMTKSTYYL